MLNARYMKASRKRQGFIQKPFEILTDELISFYLNESKKEVDEIHPILKNSPEILNVCNELSIWHSLYADFKLLGVSNDLCKMYDYQGAQFTLSVYLQVRGCIEENSIMVAVAYALHIALLKIYFLHHNNIVGLAGIVDSAYYSGQATSLASFQGEVVAGSSRTGEATRATAELKKEKVELTRIEAIKLKKKYPNIKKNAIAQLIYEKVGRSESTVLDYLKKITL